MSNTKPYISKLMFDALVRMAEGWELARMSFNAGSSWIQEGAVGRGGKVEKVHGNTVDSLDRHRYVRRSSEKLGTVCWRITERGRRAVEENRSFFGKVDHEKDKNIP